MNLDSFKALVANHNFDYVEAYIPFRWLGQGWGYKITPESFDLAKGDEVVYISEMGMEHLMSFCGTGEDLSDVAWTKKDFVDLCKGDEAAARVVVPRRRLAEPGCVVGRGKGGGITVKIKGFDKDLRCRGFQFEVGKTYDTGAKELRLCSNTVFHYCDSIQKVHQYYGCDENNRFCEIEVIGEEVTDGNKCGSNRIRIVREIVGAELNVLLGRIDGNTGLFNTGYSNTGNCNTGNCNTGDKNTGDCNTGCRNTGNCNTGDKNTGDCNTGWRNTGNCNTGDCNTGDCNTGWRNTGNCNTGDYNTGDYNTGHHNTGMFNSCSYASGIFCNKPEHIRIFNCDSGMTAEEFYCSEYYRAIISSKFILTNWVKYTEEEMDTDEKRCIGWYLKKYTYKEACANWWKKMTDKNRAIVMSMPNFDPEVFFDITGIKVESEAENA